MTPSAFAIAITVIALTGCAVGPKYRAPAVPIQPFHNAGPVAARTTSAIPAPSLDEWWTGFHDPSLTRIVKRAIEQNLDLQASLERVEQARAVVRQAGARRKPQGTVNAQTLSFRQSLESQFGKAARNFPGYDRNQNYYELGVGATWEADLFGSLKRGIEIASIEVQVAEAQRVGIRISIAAEAADAYMQVRAAQTRLAFAGEEIALDEHLVKLIRQRKDAGVAADRELAQVEALLAQARAAVPPLNVVLESQLNRLDVLMGAQPGTYSAELTAQPLDIPAVPAIAGIDAPMDLLRRRPDIIAAERRLAGSNARIAQSLTEYYPKLSLSGILGSAALAPARLFLGDTFQPVGVVGLRWRLFDFGRVDAEVKQAKGVSAERLIEYRSVVLRAAEDVEDAFSQLVQSELRRNEILAEISALQRVRDRSQEAYEAGVIPLTDVLDASRQLLNARDNLATSREGMARAAVQSFRALGGGWVL